MTSRKPRKMPKNQRAYPKGKQTFVDVQQPEAGELMDANIRGDIAAPHIAMSSTDTFMGKLVSVRVKSSELKKWRSANKPSGDAK